MSRGDLLIHHLHILKQLGVILKGGKASTQFQMAFKVTVSLMSHYSLASELLHQEYHMDCSGIEPGPISRLESSVQSLALWESLKGKSVN